LPKRFPEAEVVAALGAAPLRSEPITGGGYGSNTRRWRVELDDGRAAFVKLALDEMAAEWLRDEHRVYSQLEAPFLPRFLGWHDDGETLLALEDLSDAHWPPPWQPGQIEQVLATLEQVAATPAPAGLPTLEDLRERLNGWELVAEDPKPILSSGLVTREWLDGALPALRKVGATCDLAGEALLHLDVRSDNLCFREGRVFIVDWNIACVGNSLMDVVFWLPSLRLEGGPEPWAIVPDTGGLAALSAGYFGSRAGLPTPETAPRVRPFQRAQAELALPWAATELGLPPP
jgi:Phosphotransferase enzyme family